MSVWGMDDDEARAMAARMQQESARVRELARRLQAELGSTPWVGADRERFEARWSGSVGPALLGIADQLEQSGQHLAEQAERQAHASR